MTPWPTVSIVPAIRAVAILLLATGSAHAGPPVTLHLSYSAGALTFRLTGDEGNSPWLLQHTRDGKEWKDFVFLDRVDDTSDPRVVVDLATLPESDTSRALFRATRLDREDPFYRSFLAARMQWEASGLSSYTYEVRWNWSMFQWLGTKTVDDDVVTSFEKIMSYPDGLQPLDLLTIDGWFDKIADARTQGAEVIEVRWHPDYGFPVTGFIDWSLLIADEEQSWQINSFSPMR